LQRMAKTRRKSKLQPKQLLGAGECQKRLRHIAGRATAASALTVVLLLGGGVLHGQTPVESYRGIPFGSTETKARGVVKFESCKTTPSSFGLTGKLAKRMCAGSFSVGSVKVKDSVFFMNDAMVNAFMSFSSSAYPRIRDVFLDKYGKPTTEQHGVLQNRLGAQFENETLTWTGAKVTVSLTKFEGNLDSGSAMFALNTFTAEYIKAQATEKRKAKEAL
jgi:hypothetical protein